MRVMIPALRAEVQKLKMVAMKAPWRPRREGNDREREVCVFIVGDRCLILSMGILLLGVGCVGCGGGGWGLREGNSIEGRKRVRHGGEISDQSWYGSH